MYAYKKQDEHKERLWWRSELIHSVCLAEWITHCIKPGTDEQEFCFTFLPWQPKHPRAVGVMKHNISAMGGKAAILYRFVQSLVLSIPGFQMLWQRNAWQHPVASPYWWMCGKYKILDRELSGGRIARMLTTSHMSSEITEWEDQTAPRWGGSWGTEEGQDCCRQTHNPTSTRLL